MNDLDLEYTGDDQTPAASDPISEIRLLAGSVDNLTFGQSRAARIVIDWLDVVAPVEEAETDER